MQDWLWTCGFAPSAHTDFDLRQEGKLGTHPGPVLHSNIYCAAAWHATATRHSSTWPQTQWYTAARCSAVAIDAQPCSKQSIATVVSASSLPCYKYSIMYHICCKEHVNEQWSVLMTPVRVTGRLAQMSVGEQMHQLLLVKCVTCHWGRPPQPLGEQWTAGRGCWSSAAAHLSGGPPPLPGPPGSQSLPGWPCAADDSAGPKSQCRPCCFLKKKQQKKKTPTRHFLFSMQNKENV